MKTTITKLSIFSLLLLVLVSCKKDAEMPNGEFVNLKTNEATEITAISAVVNAVAKANCTERGVCWGKSSNPTIADFHVANGSGKGEYTCTLTDLQPNQKYYYRAYGFDGKRYAYAKDEKEFVTKDGVVKVTTDSVCEITTTTARVKCEVTHDGGSAITERGVCWSKDHEPTLDDEHLANGSSLGMFICALNGLEPDVTYQVRAYAKNASGLGFGEVLTFTTNAQVQKPTVSTVEVTDVTATSATCTGNVSSDGGAEVTERGACWSTTENPTISGTHLANGSGTGSFTVNMTGLTANKTYYVRTYATNSQGTAYGEQKTFTTTEGLAVVTTGSVTEVTATSAKCGGNVTDQGASAVTERGICWSTNHNPTLNDSHIAGGSGTGSFTCQMTGLTPNATYYVRAYAKNSQGVSYGSEVSFTALEGLPVVTTNDVTDITANTAKCGGNVTDQGGSNVTERGVCWSTSHNPTTTGAHANSGTGGGSYTCTMTGLAPGTTYYVRAYAINGQGPAYGEEKEFTTPANKPTVTTNSITDITQTTATGGGNVTDDGGATVTERGICWSTSQNPTIDGSHAANGTGTGSFTVQMTGLTANTTYYVRAYAKNSQGIAYGDEVSFRTSQNISAPTVVTLEVTDITQTTATVNGNVTSDGGANVTERGICWSTSHNPTTSGSHASNGTGTGSYTVQMTGLTPGTTYYVRAYATNSASTAYGSEVSFTTQSGGGSGTLTFTANGVTFEMIEVEGGTFWMGAQGTNPSGQNYDSEAESREQPVHQVTLSSYHIGKFEVTQQLWQAVMGSNPSHFTGDSQRPVEQVSWNDCQEFITKLNQLCASQLNGRQFCLPTEAEWEYAARGGKQSRGYKYSGSNTLGSVAWYTDNSGSTTHAVGTKQANELGLYDMSGNVWEWCSDWYGSYGSGAQTNPTGPATGSYRVFRGGGWNIIARNCRVSSRYYYAPDNRGSGLGLRLSFR